MADETITPDTSAEQAEESVPVNRELLLRVIEAVRPSLQADGGDLKFVDEQDGVVTVELTGNCAGCPLSTMTMSMGVERVLRENVPGVKRVEAAMGDGGAATDDDPFGGFYF